MPRWNPHLLARRYSSGRVTLVTAAAIGLAISVATTGADPPRLALAAANTGSAPPLLASDVPAGYHRIGTLSGPVTLTTPEYRPWRRLLIRSGWLRGYRVTYERSARWYGDIGAVIGAKVMAFRSSRIATLDAVTASRWRTLGARTIPCNGTVGLATQCWSANLVVPGEHPHDRYTLRFKMVRFRAGHDAAQITMMSAKGFDRQPTTAEAMSYASKVYRRLTAGRPGEPSIRRNRRFEKRSSASS